MSRTSSQPVSEPPLTISAIERETGLSKDVLRKWEGRYGFPCPSRDRNGDRLYPPEQLARLRLIKRLLDTGHRPAEVVPLDIAALTAIVTGQTSCDVNPVRTGIQAELIDILRRHDPSALRKTLRNQLVRHGLEAFVLDIMPTIACQVGEAWAQGQIQVFHEHHFSETLQAVVRDALTDIAADQGQPTLLLTTPPGEQHTLGLQMVEALLVLQGARCISLGSQTPVADIAEAAQAYGADIVGLSFSTAYNWRQIAPTLADLRQRLPRRFALWAGGSGIRRVDRVPEGVVCPGSLKAAMDELTRFAGGAA